ncbi:MAG: hypothetical protein ACRDM1_15125, partial [Gaiellaceae bacterium]
MIWWLIPIIILGVLLVALGLLVFLGRFRNGALLRPVIARLSRVGFMRRFFTKISTAAIERQNPELASAIRKLQRVGANPDEKRVQAAYHSLSAAERRAYHEFAEQQGTSFEAPNRELRRRQQRVTQGNQGNRPSGSPNRKRKRK